MKHNKRRNTKQDTQNSFPRAPSRSSHQHSLNPVNDLIHQYLLKNNLIKTIAVFQAQQPFSTDIFAKDYIDRLLDSFDRGDSEEFFHQFRLFVPPSIRGQDWDTLRIEFYLQLYFLIRSSANGRRSSRQQLDTKALSAFRKYLQSKGQSLSSTSQFVSYFGIHAVQRPQEHPTFKHLFDREFSQNLRERLLTYLSCLYSDTDIPLAVEIYQKYINHELNEVDGEELQRLKGQNQQLIEVARDLDQKYKVLMNKNRTITEMSKSSLLQSQQKWFSMLKEAVQISLYLKSHVKKDDPRLEQVFVRLLKFQHFTNTSLEDLAAGNKELSIFQRYSYDQLSRSQLNNSYIVSSDLLDFNKIKVLIKQTATHPQLVNKAGALLQALRFRLARTRSVFMKREAAILLVENDILGMKDSVILGTLFGLEANPILRNCTLRLLEYMVDDYKCRQYISQEESLIASLIDLVQSGMLTEDESRKVQFIFINLSTRKLPQQIMIERGLIEHYFSVLLKEKQGDNSLDHKHVIAVATQIINLILNLSLCEAGVKKCLLVGDAMIRVFNDLLESPSLELRQCVNGALYSLFSHEQFRSKAKAIGMDSFLQTILEQQPNSSAIKSILERLQTLEGDLQFDAEDDDIDEIAEGIVSTEDGQEEESRLGDEPRGEEALRPYVVDNPKEKERIQQLVEESLRRKNEMDHSKEFSSSRILEKSIKPMENEFIDRINSPQFQRHQQTSESMEDLHRGQQIPQRGQVIPQRGQQIPQRDSSMQGQSPSQPKKPYEKSKEYQEAFGTRNKTKRTPPEGMSRNEMFRA